MAFAALTVASIARADYTESWDTDFGAGSFSFVSPDSFADAGKCYFLGHVYFATGNFDGQMSCDIDMSISVHTWITRQSNGQLVADGTTRSCASCKVRTSTGTAALTQGTTYVYHDHAELTLPINYTWWRVPPQCQANGRDAVCDGQGTFTR